MRLSQLLGHVTHSDSGAAGGGGDREPGQGEQRDSIGLEKEDRCEKDTRGREEREGEGSLLIGPRHTLLAH